MYRLSVLDQLVYRHGSIIVRVIDVYYMHKNNERSPGDDVRTDSRKRYHRYLWGVDVCTTFRHGAGPVWTLTFLNSLF